MYNILVVHIVIVHKDRQQTVNYSIIVQKNMLSWIQGAAILKHRTSDVSQIVYVTGALLENAKLGGGLARNCESDVS